MSANILAQESAPRVYPSVGVSIEESAETRFRFDYLGKGVISRVPDFVIFHGLTAFRLDSNLNLKYRGKLSGAIQRKPRFFRGQFASSCNTDKHALFENIFAVSESARQPGWDGYGAEPVPQEIYRHAYSFAEKLPNDIPTPAVTAEPDGQLGFEWYISPTWTLSVSVSPEGDLHYAALLGSNKSYGTEEFRDEVPASILSLIHRVYA